MLRKIGPTVLAAMTIGAALLVGNFALSVSNTRQLRDESARVLHSNELLLALDNVLTLVKDAETGQRGYVITGKPAYLVPYQAATASIGNQLDVLDRLIEDDPVHQRLMAEVRRRVGAKLGELALTIDLRERKGFDLTRDVIVLGTGQAEMEALRKAVAEMASHETQRLVAREAATDRTYRRAIGSEIAAGLAAMLALAAFAFLLVRHLRARDHAQATIGAQNERLRITLASIGDAVITTDLDGRVTNLNPVAEALTGWPNAEAQGQALENVFAIVNETSRQPVENPALRALREGAIVGLANHTVLLGRDGTEAPIDDSAAPIRDAAGRIFGCVLVFRDISERKATERALDAAQSRLHRVVTDMAIPTMVYADDGKVLLVNEAWTDITGYPASALTTIREWTQRAYGARGELMQRVIESFFDLRDSVDNGEREVTTASGDKRIWHFVTAPLGRDERGRRTLVTNAIDVTERRRLDAVLVASEARMRLAMEAANYGGWEWERESGEMIWSDKTRELLGIGADEPVSFEQFQLHIHPDDRQRRERAIAAAWLTGVHSNEYRVVRPDGEVRWLSSRGRVIHAPDGRRRMLGVIGDITEQKHLIAALQDDDRRKDEFLATLAHELRNPLAPLRNSLAILQRTLGDPADHSKAKRRDGAPAQPPGAPHRRPARRQPHQPRQADLAREVVDLAALVEHAVEDLPAGGRARAATSSRSRLPDGPCACDGDRARLAQVFGNLIGNACKFTPGGGRIEVVVQARGRRGRGRGARQRHRHRRRRCSTASSRCSRRLDDSLERSHGGLGIGLTIVKRLVEMHGGEVVGDERGPGRGSEFIVRLPTARGLPSFAPPSADKAAKPPSHAEPRRILVVDDNGDSADSLAMLLALAGHETHVARDGQEALARAEALRPEAILLDLGLPGLNGYEVCRRLRALAWARATPIIAITGWGQADDRQRSREAGFDGHLVKPVVLDELSALLGERTLG